MPGFCIRVILALADPELPPEVFSSISSVRGFLKFWCTFWNTCSNQSEIIWSWAFVCRKLFNDIQNFCYASIQMRFWSLVSFSSLSISFQVTQICYIFCSIVYYSDRWCSLPTAAKDIQNPWIFTRQGEDRIRCPSLDKLPPSKTYLSLIMFWACVIRQCHYFKLTM